MEATTSRAMDVQDIILYISIPNVCSDITRVHTHYTTGPGCCLYFRRLPAVVLRWALGLGAGPGKLSM
jgi:hypothetical protein